MEAITEMRNPMLPGSDEAGVEQKERVSIVDFKMVTFSLAGKDHAIDSNKCYPEATGQKYSYASMNVAGSAEEFSIKINELLQKGLNEGHCLWQ